MVAAAVMAVMMVLISTVVGVAGQTVRTASAKVDAFQGARLGFDAVTRTLSQATLNTYWDYFDSARQPRTAGNAATFQPSLYGRQSDLHFLATNTSVIPSLPGLEASGHALFFQTPLGYPSSGNHPSGTLNAGGFFVAYGNDPAKPNVGTLPDRPRFRLYQWLQPTSGLGVDSATGVVSNAATWVAPGADSIFPVADNIVAFVARVPSTAAATATDYFWDSRPAWSSGAQPHQMHQLPPLVEVTMVAVDEVSAGRLLEGVNSANGAAAALGLPPLGTLFTDEKEYNDDLATLQSGLAAKGVSYRVFRTAVPLRGSKWSP
jgi:uncharacterized protein (TIGR02599 family)